MALESVLLSLVKVEINTGKAVLLFSAGREDIEPYVFDWNEYLGFYQSVVLPEEGQKIASLLSMEQLKGIWNEGSSQYRVDLNCRKDTKIEWLEIVLHFVEGEDGPVAYVLTRLGGESNLLRRIIDLYVYNKCDCFIYVDVRANSYTMFNGKKDTPLPPVVCADYEAEIERFAEAYVVPDDREMMIREMRLDRVTEVLSTQDVHTFTCGFWEQGVGYTRKQFEYRYYNREKQMILLARTDITPIYEEQKRASADLQAALLRAQTDPLTQLLNYQGIQDAVSANLQRFGRMSAVLFIDLDDFKEVNDTFGHSMGDMALQKVAEVLKKSIRANDYASRIGGDEFVIFLTDIPDATCALKCAERICKKLGEEDFKFGDIHLSCSIGVAIAPLEGTEYTDLVKKADKKVYQAKSRGKNQVAI